MTKFTVNAAFDEEAGAWYVENSDLRGLNAEGKTLDELVAKLPGMITDLLLDENGAETYVSVKIVAHRHSTVRPWRAA